MFISPGALTRLLSRSTITFPRSVRLASCWSASAVSGVGRCWPAMWFPAIELRVSVSRDESEFCRSRRERNAAACRCGELECLVLLPVPVPLPFVPVPFVQGKA